MRVKLVEVIRAVRPIIHAIAILAQGRPNFKSLLASFIVDILVLVMQVGYTPRDSVE